MNNYLNNMLIYILYTSDNKCYNKLFVHRFIDLAQIYIYKLFCMQ